MPTTQVRPLAIGGLIVPVLAFSLYLTYTYIVRYLRQREFKTEHGCKPVLKRFAAKDPILGSDWILGNLKSAREHQYLNTLAKRYDDAGTTFATRVLSTRAICTIDPENIKTVLSLRFQDYSIGNRPRIMGPLLGKGIFTTDGKDWAHSRALLRPCFVKEEQNADLEKHFGNLLELLPRDGSTVDLQPLFFRYTLDTATEFLFGRSVHSLLGGAEADKVFADNFTTSLGELAYRIRMGPFLFLRRNKEADIAFRACRDYVEEFVQEALGVKSSLRSGDFENGGKDLFLRELAKSVNDPERIKDELLNILIAGRDTTASKARAIHLSRTTTDLDLPRFTEPCSNANQSSSTCHGTLEAGFGPSWELPAHILSASGHEVFAICAPGKYVNWPDSSACCHPVICAD